MMRKFLAFIMLTLLCVGSWAQTNLGITNWSGETTFPIAQQSDGSTNVTKYVLDPIAPICVQQEDVEIGAGDLTVTFQYTPGGSWGLDIVGVDLVQDDVVVKSDYHNAFTGSSSDKNTFTLSGVVAGTYTFRYWVPRNTHNGVDLTTTDNSSQGTISYSLSGEAQSQFTNTGWTINETFRNPADAVVPAGLWEVMRTELFGTRGWNIAALSSISKNYNNDNGVRYNDQTVTLEEKSYYVYYRYSGGSHGLTIKAVELLDANGKKVSIDYNLENNPADAFTGNQKRNATFKFTAPKAGTYTLRTIIGNGNDMDTRGNIYYYEASDLEGQFAAMKNVIVQKRLLYPKSSLPAAQNVITYTVADDNYSQLGDYLYAVKDLSGANVNTLTADKYYTIRGTFNIQDAVDRYVINNDGTLAANTIDGDIPTNACWKYTNNTFQSASDPTKYIAVSGGNMMLHTSGKAFTLEKGVLFGNIAIKSDNIYMALSTSGAIDHFSDNKHNPYGQYSTDFIIEEIEAPVDELTQAKRIAQALIEANTPLVIGKPSKAVRDELQSVLDKEDVTVEELNAAITAYNTTTNIYLPDGYYYMKGMATDRHPYLYNNKDQANKTYHTDALVQNDNKFIWKVTRKADNSGITLVNGQGTGLKIDGGAVFSELTFGACNGMDGIYFTEAINLTNWEPDNGNNQPLVRWPDGGATAVDNRWTFEPVQNIASNIVVPVVVNRDDTGNACVIFDGTQTAFNGGFYVVKDQGSFQDGTESLGKLTFNPTENGSIDGRPNAEGVYTLNLYYSTEQERSDLAQEIAEAYSKIVKWTEIDGDNYLVPGEIGYPVNNIDVPEYEDLDDEYKEAYSETMGEFINTCALVHLGIDISQYAEFLDLFEAVKALPIVNKPTPSAFYTFNDKIYYLTEDSELLSYSDGLFTKCTGENIEDPVMSSFPAGTSEGEPVTFNPGRENFTYNILFGKLSINNNIFWYPSGDGNLMSGWTIKPVTELAVKSNAVADVYYSTLNMPVNVVIPAGVTAYAATINKDGKSLHLEEVELEDNRVLKANNPVILTSSASIPNVTITSEDGVDAGDNDLKGTTYAEVQANGKTYYVLNAVDGVAGFYKLMADKNLPIFRAYYISTVASSNGFAFSYAQDDLTAIEEAIISTVNKDVYRDLNGRPVVNPIKGQIYIQNGKAIKY